MYRARRTLHTGHDLLTDKQTARLEALFAVEEHVEVEATWGVYQRIIGAYRHPGDLDPWTAAIVASLLVTWVTFVPCFLFVLLGAPYVERLRHNRSLTAALTGITAAVVGVIANLAVYFALHTLFAATGRVDWGAVHVEVPQLATLQVPALLVTVVACALIFALRWSVLRTLGVCALLGLAVQLLLLR